MPYLTVGRENSGDIQLYYEDHGQGQPVVLVAGFPLGGASWERQLPPLLSAGYRVITYDRRGFGLSSQPAVGYDTLTLTEDLNALLTALELRDVLLVGFSMGTCEVVRYVGLYGTERLRKVVLMAPVQPFLLQTDDNPEGVPRDVFDGIMNQISTDRFAYLGAFVHNFYNVDELGGTRISDEAARATFQMSVVASPIATRESVLTWIDDYRQDLTRLDVPLLVMQGKRDRNLPIDKTGRRLPALVPGARLVEIDGPHAFVWTHADEANPALLDFLGQEVTQPA
ncbi:alpha/beta fold hydrolase [Deinococcus pimensis]|uniref:alpha/beta fold hydrolase n=1 Tax=Deinococcus pimensis TaxID=309888 RepID=UPI000482FB06|nr:alpha/beta hydrolase [Deinococcus pimensis]